ncbi:hypothetical protein HY478_00895 [Candidatus Uhrbacteria bacterium]|nr:hypothetical protein [Candidatus Uhrbacteria bacterium]
MPEGRTILYVAKDNPFMEAARRVCATRSTDRKHPTGAVIVRDHVIIGAAANQAGFRHPALVRFHETTLCLRRVFRVPSGTHYWLCPGCARPQNHSEPLALKNARSHGHDTKDADLYLYGHWWCCEPCWRAITEAGVRNVYLVEGATELFGDPVSV